MIESLYALCAITALLCAVLLLHAWRKSRSRLLWWSGLFFCGLGASNVMLVVDKLALPELDLLPVRLAITLGSALLLLYGLVFASE